VNSGPLIYTQSADLYLFQHLGMPQVVCNSAATAWFARAAKRVLLMPRSESQPPPSPSIEPPQPPSVLLEPPQWAPRSCVTHAVLGSEARGLHTLPPELLFMTFQMLDAVSLCRLAQASKWTQSYADDPLVWEPSQGHRKTVERARCWHEAQMRAAAKAAEEAERRHRWRHRKRRLLSCLEMMAGVLVIVCALFFSSRSSGRQADLSGPESAPNKSAVPTAKSVPPPLPTLAPSQMRAIVWKAAS